MHAETRMYAPLPAAEYARFYNRGWRASAGDLSMGEAEDRFLRRSHPTEAQHDAWQDGWLDYASDRDKWHLRDCPNHGHGPGTCGEG